MAKFKKYIRYFIFATIATYILAIILSAIKINGLMHVNYKSNGWGVTLREINIDFTQNKVYRKYYDFGGKETDYKELEITPKQGLRTKIILTFSLFPLWRKTYINPNISDGDQWIIETNYNTITGSNSYPLTYWIVFKTINDIIK